jgi:hypothetical protein
MWAELRKLNAAVAAEREARASPAAAGAHAANGAGPSAAAKRVVTRSSAKA